MVVLSQVAVYEVRSILSSFNLPAELVLDIMGMAEYHPTLRAERSHNLDVAAHSVGGGCWAAKLYLVSAPLPERSPEDRVWKVRKVSWEVQGHDQGWTSYERPGTYRSTASTSLTFCSTISANDVVHNDKGVMSGPGPGSTYASSGLFTPPPTTGPSRRELRGT